MTQTKDARRQVILRLPLPKFEKLKRYAATLSLTAGKRVTVQQVLEDFVDSLTPPATLLQSCETEKEE